MMNLAFSNITTDKFSWQKQPEIYTFEEMMKVVGPNQLWKITRTATSIREYFKTGPNASIDDSKEDSRNVFWIRNGQYVENIYSLPADFEGSGTINKSNEPFTLISGAPKISSLKLGWKLPDLRTSLKPGAVLRLQYYGNPNFQYFYIHELKGVIKDFFKTTKPLTTSDDFKDSDLQKYYGIRTDDGLDDLIVKYKRSSFMDLGIFLSPNWENMEYLGQIEDVINKRTATLKFADPYTYTETSGINDGQSMKEKSLMFHTEEATDIDQPVDTMWLEPDINFNDPSNENTINRLDVNDNKILENERNRKKTIAWQKQLPPKIYEGALTNHPLGDLIEGFKYFVSVNGEEFNYKPSLGLVNHSPAGFAWGYMGSGPAQLALAILYDYTNDRKFAIKYHQMFKEDFVAGWPKDETWTLTSDEIDNWIKEKIIEKQAWQIQHDIKEESTWGEIRRKIKEELGYDIFIKPFEDKSEDKSEESLFWIIIETPDEFSELPKSIRDVKRNEILLLLKQFDSQIDQSVELHSRNFAYSIGK